jgi:hypothetical protein
MLSTIVPFKSKLHLVNFLGNDYIEMSKEAIVIGSFLVLVVIAFIAFLIYHFVTRCDGCPGCPANANANVLQETNNVQEVQDENPWYAD